MRNNMRQRGFTLIEMLLVLVVISFIIRMGANYFNRYSMDTRIDRTAADMQQILSAGLVFYIGKNAWPAEDPSALAHLQGKVGGTDQRLIPIALDFTTGAALPAGTYPTPWSGMGGGASYVVRSSVPSESQGVLYVGVQLPIRSDIESISKQLQAKLPMAITSTADFKTQAVGTTIATPQPCTTSSAQCWVIASVNPPAQSLSNVGNVQFANLYSHGGCVPAPQCPADPATGTLLKPQVFIVPITVMGQNRANNMYPLYSFSAYATGDPAAGDEAGMPQANTPTTPPLCGVNGTMPVKSGTGSCGEIPTKFSEAPSKKYWRACLRVVSDKGVVSEDNPDWGKTVQLLAVTRCAPPNEKIGSGLDVWGR